MELRKSHNIFAELSIIYFPYLITFRIICFQDFSSCSEPGFEQRQLFSSTAKTLQIGIRKDLKCSSENRFRFVREKLCLRFLLIITPASQVQRPCNEFFWWDQTFHDNALTLLVVCVFAHVTILLERLQLSAFLK